MNNKTLHAKAETLWQTLCAVLQAAHNGQTLDPKELDKVLKENRPEEEWISVEDRLPDEGGRYWCYVREVTDLGVSHFQWNCCYNEDTKTFTDSTLTNGENITHWMPLPEPPTINNK